MDVPDLNNYAKGFDELLEITENRHHREQHFCTRPNPLSCRSCEIYLCTRFLFWSLDKLGKKNEIIERYKPLIESQLKEVLQEEFKRG